MHPSLLLTVAILCAYASHVDAAPTIQPDDASLCMQAVVETERESHLPAQLLVSIGVVESGRFEPARHATVPWPWTINVAGTGRFYATKSDAVAAVQSFQAAGIQSIDVGCMQVSLLYHPDAFGSLDQAFDPQANTVFAARFLSELFHDTGSWPKAAAAYHSRTPDIAAAYWQKVAAVWPLASRYDVGTATSVAAHLAQVDPYGVETPEFAARLEADATFRSARDAMMRGSDCSGDEAGCAVGARSPARAGRRGGEKRRAVLVQDRLAGGPDRLSAPLQEAGS